MTFFAFLSRRDAAQAGWRSMLGVVSAGGPGSFPSRTRKLPASISSQGAGDPARHGSHPSFLRVGLHCKAL